MGDGYAARHRLKGTIFIHPHPRPMRSLEAYYSMGSRQGRRRGELGKRLMITFTALAGVTGMMCAA